MHEKNLLFLIKSIEKLKFIVYNILVNSFTVCCMNTVYANTLHNVRHRNIVYSSTLHNVRHRNIVYQPSVQNRGFPFREFFSICEYFEISVIDFFDTDRKNPKVEKDVFEGLSKLDEAELELVRNLVYRLGKKDK